MLAILKMIFEIHYLYLSVFPRTLWIPKKQKSYLIPVNSRGSQCLTTGLKHVINYDGKILARQELTCWITKSILKNSIFLKPNEKTTQLKMAKDINSHFISEDIQMANRHVKRCPTSYVVRKMHIQTTMYRYILRMTKIQSLTTAKHWWECGVTGILSHWCWECKLVQCHFGRQLGSFLQN